MVQKRKSTSDDYRKERRFPNLKNSSSPSGTALLLLPYPVALFLPTTISPFYCKAAVLPRNTLAAARFLRSFEKGKHIRRRIHTARENLGAGEPGWGAGLAGAALGPLRGGAQGCGRLPRCRNPAAAARAGPPGARDRPPQ